MKFGCMMLTVVFWVAGFASAEWNGSPYIRIGGGAAIPQNSVLSSDEFKNEIEYDDGGIFQVAAGLELAETAGRVELEFAYQKHDIDNEGDTRFSEGLSLMSLMVNSYFDIRNETRFMPYALAGIGMAKVDAELFSVSKNDDVIAFQIGAGLAIELIDNLSIDTEYRYYMTTDPEFDSVQAEVAGHRAQMSLRYTFR